MFDPSRWIASCGDGVNLRGEAVPIRQNRHERVIIQLCLYECFGNDTNPRAGLTHRDDHAHVVDRNIALDVVRDLLIAVFQNPLSAVFIGA